MHISSIVRTLISFSSATLLLLAPMGFGQTGQLSGAATSLPVSNASGSKGSASFAVQPSSLTPVPEDFSKLKLGPGFLLNINVYDAPELSGQFRIDDHGSITIPLISPVSVSGLSVPEAEAQIDSLLLSEGILLHPQASINVLQFAPYFISVTGEVMNPGRIQVLGPRTLMDVLSLVGGVTELAGDSVFVTETVDGILKTERYHYTKQSSGELISKVTVKYGSTVSVPRAGIVYVLGAVGRPGGYVMQEDGKLDVAEALAMANGAALDAEIGGIRVVRRKSDGSLSELRIDYNAISKGKQVPLNLQAQDIVYVPVSHTKALLTSSLGLLAAATSATIYVVH